jgi:hypothetical protein
MPNCICGFMFFSGVERHAAECPISILTKERDALLLQVEQARKLIEVMKRGDCWCEMAVGNPMVKGHAIFCQEAARFIEKRNHEFCQYQFSLGQHCLREKGHTGPCK